MDDALFARLLQYMQAPEYTPQDASALARGLGLDSRERKAMRDILRQGEQAGTFLRLRQRRYTLRKTAATPLKGRVYQRSDGRLTFVADTEGQQRLQQLMPTPGRISLTVPKFHTAGAMDGDLVRADVRRAAPAGYRRRHRGKRHENSELSLNIRIEEILERRHDRWVGIYRPMGKLPLMEGDGRSSPARVKLTGALPTELQDGMAILVEAQHYPVAHSEATGRVLQVLGYPQESGVEMTMLLHRYALSDTFPKTALEEARQLPKLVLPHEKEGRDDWRERCIVTIDPQTARDYDDAISVTRLANGDWEAAIHIADVSHYVQPGSALDQEARRRGNSTYLPDRVLPMLPPSLSDGLCSLQEGEERLTRLCLLRINAQGNITQSSHSRAIIRSRKRLTYKQALAVLEQRGSTGDTEADAMLQEAGRLAALLRKRRFAEGALNLELPEYQVILDSQGNAVDVSLETSDAAHQMVEELMLAANEQVAWILRGKMAPTLYRVHEEPDPAKLQEFAQTARSYGYQAGALYTRQELTRLMEQILGSPDEDALKTALLRSLMRARYSPSPLGHYGLAKGDYCHFTSPIRRYADLIVHRALNHLEEPRVPLPSPARLAEWADHLSETERNSAAAESEARRLKLTEYLESQCQAEHPRIWTAAITGALPQGLTLELPELRLKGYLSAHRLPGNSRWYFERSACRWSSFDGQQLQPGDRLEVVPDHVDSLSGFTEFRPASVRT